MKVASLRSFQDVVCILFYLLLPWSVHCSITPSELVSFRSQTSTFVCRGRGNIIWHIGDVPISYKTIGSLTYQGITVDTQESENEMESSLKISPAQDRSTKNVTLKCVVVGNSFITSSTASLYIIDMSSVNLTLPTSNPNQFLLTWDRVQVPSGYEVLHYSVEVADENNKVLRMDSVGSSEEPYQYSYISNQSRSSLHTCSQRRFSVAAVTSNGRTESVNITWENKIAEEKELTNVYCSVVNTSFVKVDFEEPIICSFEEASFSVSLSLNNQQTGYLAGQITGVSGDSVTKLVKSSVAVDFGRTFEATVSVKKRGKVLLKTIVCYDSPVTNGLSLRDSSDLTKAQLAVTITLVLITLIVLIVLIVSLVIFVTR